MRYIVIKRALKKDCWDKCKADRLCKIPSDLWTVWDKRELPDEIKPLVYCDNMEDEIEELSKNNPSYFWDWEVIQEGAAYYNILIDGIVYEGSADLEKALHLYGTIGETCLSDYYGHNKALQVTEGDKTITLKVGVIKPQNLNIKHADR